ncbi:MAG: hypothetical protein O3C40_34465 [Planctomycetota bacterium]|nr:hypothetical protein [Planctomycetota bacterium]
MKLVTMCGLIAASYLLMSANLMAQEPADDEPAPAPARAKKKVVVEEKLRDISYLPTPLSDVRTNVLELERSGYFAIEAVELRTRGSGDEAIVWTVSVKKAVTCRHVEAMLREFRDVRFYSTIEKQKLEVLATLVQYSERISLGSSNNRLLRQGDVFELWIDLPTTYLQKLVSMDADTLVLRRWRY